MGTYNHFTPVTLKQLQKEICTIQEDLFTKHIVSTILITSKFGLHKKRWHPQLWLVNVQKWNAIVSGIVNNYIYTQIVALFFDRQCSEKLQ